MKRLLVAALLFVPSLASASTFADAIGLGGGVQVSWFDQAKVAYDTEAGVKAALSLTPHISGVGSGYYGFGQSYGRGEAGLRFTVTDIADPKFSVGIGLERQWYSRVSMGADEWVGDVSVGWKAIGWGILGAQGAYGIQQKDLRTSVGLTVPFKVVKGAS